MFPHVVTLYNTKENLVTFKAENNITILRGVLLDATKAANVNTSGLEGADSVNLYIPFSVEAIDGISFLPKNYVSPKTYETEERKDLVWTLEVGDECFFVKGEAVEPSLTFQQINAKYDSVHTVTKVDMKDFGAPDMEHWEVGGA
jgi:hypothetical protein|nr:MAG TPA: hypothetical protein [Bacteriophage sp.]